MAAVIRIRDRRALRYLSLVVALAAAALLARGLRTGDTDTDVVESFHFVEYGLVTFLFYRVWRASGDVSVFVLPVLAGLLVGALDEWLQWFVPSRVGEMRDIVLDGVAVVCGLLFSVGVSPPARFTIALHRGSAARLGAAAIAVTVVMALFFQSVHLGSDVRDPGIGTFRSRYTRAQLEAAARERADRWRGAPPSAPGRLSREDQYVSEGLWHVRHRNQAVAAGDAFGAWRENRILETYYAPLLQTGTYEGPGGFAWPAEQRAEVARAAGGDDRPYVSDAAPLPIYDWPKPVFWSMVALAAGAILGLAVSAVKKEPPPP